MRPPFSTLVRPKELFYPKPCYVDPLPASCAMTDEMVRWSLNAVYGGLAGGTARMAVHPFDTVKRRMQAHVFVAARPDKYGRIPHFTSFWGCFHHIVEHEGACARARVPVLCVSRMYASFQLSIAHPVV